jgi:hypothetical protein
MAECGIKLQIEEMYLITDKTKASFKMEDKIGAG